MCIAADFDNCEKCHQESYDQWSFSAHGNGDCGICHTPAEAGFEGHIAEPSASVPTANLSSEVCADCHATIFAEWNEFDAEGFDMETMASHSEPTEIAEPYVLHSGTSCVVCKSTDGGILNLKEAEVYMLNEEEAHDIEVTEWTISCVACHDPHAGGLWLEDSTLLCGNCHNTEGVVADGTVDVVRHAQWEMVSSSVYADGTHPEIGCVDCHMAIVPSDGGMTTGHDFNFDAVALSDPDSSNGCYMCHQDELASLIEEKQEPISHRLSELNSLKEEANVALEGINGTESFGSQLANYNNGLFYLTEVENDGSLGIHNMLLARSDLDIAEDYFNLVIEGSSAVEEPADKVPGISGPIVVLIIAAVGILMKRD
ncbi:MAG: ammonia-forming cytochrome c nitrite reductase subunit c552 [Halobacteriota archaeon]